MRAFPTTDAICCRDALRQATEHRFDILLVFKADRLSRQAFEYPFILTSLKRASVRVIAVADDAGGRELRLKGQADKLIRFIEGWQAETESLNTSIRVSEAMRHMAEKERWTGGGPHTATVTTRAPARPRS